MNEHGARFALLGIITLKKEACHDASDLRLCELLICQESSGSFLPLNPLVEAQLRVWLLIAEATGEDLKKSFAALLDWSTHFHVHVLNRNGAEDPSHADQQENNVQNALVLAVRHIHIDEDVGWDV